MTIRHHPNDATLAAFAAGAMDEGRRLVVATHLDICPACRQAARAFEAVGGVALHDEAAALPLSADARKRALDSIEQDLASGQDLPAEKPAVAQAARQSALSAYPLGAWRWIGPGIYWRPVDLASPDTRVFMLKAAPGTALPDHSHTGIEWTAVLQGAFRHDHGRYGAGDFDEADESVEHNPRVEDGVECICLVAMQGQIRFKSLIGRLLQPFVRI